MYSIAEGSTLKKAVTLCDNTKDKPKSRISKISPNQSITSSKYFLDSSVTWKKQFVFSSRRDNTLKFCNNLYICFPPSTIKIITCVCIYIYFNFATVISFSIGFNIYIFNFNQLFRFCDTEKSKFERAKLHL